MFAFSAELREALRNERGDGGVGVFAGEGEEIGERETAPRSAQDGEPGDAVRGMQQCVGEGESVLDFRSFVEGVEVEGAEGDFGLAGVGLELFYNSGEMAARSGEYCNARSLGGEMLLDDATNFHGLLCAMIVNG